VVPFFRRDLERAKEESDDLYSSDLDSEAWGHAFWGEDARAVERAQPLLSGRRSCAEVPHVTLGVVALALQRLGRLEEARDAFVRGYRLAARNRDHLEPMGQHLCFLALTGNVAPGLALVERHLKWVLAARAPLVTLPFLAGARAVFTRLEETGEHEVSLSLPRAFTLHQKSGTYAAGALRDWFDAQAAALVERLNARGGNTYDTRWLEAARCWHREVRSIEVTSGIG
jgi:hypothetical protein